MRILRKGLATLVGAMMIAALAALAAPQPAGAADGGAEAAFLSSINSIRAAHGVGPLELRSSLTGVARGWTDQMVAAGGISHNPGLAGSVSGGWSKLGENVGVGTNVSTLMNAFVNSPAHYKNIVDPSFNYIGIGVSYDGAGHMYTTHDFMALGSAPASAPPSAPASAPKASKSAPAAPPAAAPEPEVAPVPAPPPPPPADAARVKTMLTALQVVGP
jgi:hypothetical protein